MSLTTPTQSHEPPHLSSYGSQWQGSWVGRGGESLPATIEIVWDGWIHKRNKQNSYKTQTNKFIERTRAYAIVTRKKNEMHKSQKQHA